MAVLPTALRILSDSLAGYLLVTALTCAFPLANKLTEQAPRILKQSLKIHPSLPDLREFHPMECLVLYLVAYPALVVYRSIPVGHVLGSLTFALGAMGVLAFGIGPAMMELGKSRGGGIVNGHEGGVDENNSTTNEEQIYKLETSGTSKMSSSNLTADTGYVPNLEDENLTPTTVNKSMQTSFPGDESPEEEDPSPTGLCTPVATDPASDTTPATSSINKRHLDLLCTGCKEMLSSKGVRISNIRSVMKRNSDNMVAEDEDALSVVTWDPAFAHTVESLKTTMTEDLKQASFPLDNSPAKGGRKHGKGRGHRRAMTSSSVQDSSLLKEMDGNLIDSNLEPHYSNLIDSANAPIFGVDHAGRVNVWNKCAMKIVGYTPDEVMGKNLVKEFITKDYQASVGMVIAKALRGDETANYEFPLMTKEGARIEILLNATARRNPSGVIIGVVGIGQDITGRIAQEREYTRLIDTANAPIFGVDTQCAVNIWNQSAIQLVGYNTEEVMGKNLVKEFITDEFKTAVQA
eukprot:CAMPEP_0172306546 /NCGR_PEP_ID=MMETSP1058-20130122/7602_1 /TAXON_ID=83371 /ORGANISM="Detonula confervacea, Strain CCMP 353" /LENGTH=519 /DNA_ID=CAMNT_0013018471 /DNA_START=277 /DNA_END=1833 /DNA_ORIENTATION=+